MDSTCLSSNSTTKFGNNNEYPRKTNMIIWDQKKRAAGFQMLTFMKHEFTPITKSNYAESED